MKNAAKDSGWGCKGKTVALLIGPGHLLRLPAYGRMIVNRDYALKVP